MRVPADGEVYNSEKQRKLISDEASEELKRLMAEHGRQAGSAAAAAGSGNVRGSEQVMQAHAQVNQVKAKL